MNTFLVSACKGIVKNVAKHTVREGYWIPVENLPADIAQQLGCDKNTARPHLAWDMQNAGWRDMRRAKQMGTLFANAVLVTLPDGNKSIALIDF